MRRNIERRLSAIESQENDWISKLEFIDYGLTDVDYGDGSWAEVFHDDFVTVVKHVETDEVRGVYCDRRSIKQIIDQGGDPAYL